MTLDGKHVLVLGLGETGLSMARWVARNGARVRVADTRDAPPSFDALRERVPQAEVRTGPFAETLLDGVDLLAISPGLALDEPVVRAAHARGIPVVGDIELFAQFVRGERDAATQASAVAKRPKVIAITGTNGKTTVTSLVGAMCRAAGCDTEVAGNISPSALDALMQRLDEDRLPEVWVLELSSFQLETTESLAADAAAMLNLTEDHLDRYRGMAEYAEAKARIFYGGGAQVLNRDDSYSNGMTLPGRRVITFGLDPALEGDDFGLLKVFDEYWLSRGMTPLLATREMRLAGLHNAANALAALALCRAIGLSLTPLIETLRTFTGLPHRVERVAEVGGVTYYDDSKGTNVGSTVAALAGFARQLETRGGKVVLIAGGEGKQQNFAPLREPVALSARAVVLIGRDAAQIEQALAGSGSDVPIVHAASMEEAVQRARAAAQPGDVVLLSPACASFDMFRNYKHRGEVFAAAVRALDHAAD